MLPTAGSSRFGDAGFFGSTGAIKLNQPVIAMAPTPDGQGYWLAAADAGIFTFGDAHYLGGGPFSEDGDPPITDFSSFAVSSDGGGYLLADTSGAFLLNFGDAPYYGLGYSPNHYAAGRRPDLTRAQLGLLGSQAGRLGLRADPLGADRLLTRGPFAPSGVDGHFAGSCCPMGAGPDGRRIRGLVSFGCYRARAALRASRARAVRLVPGPASRRVPEALHAVSP